ncbi:MAG TPA: hypothetical protein H9986_07870 [Candidatus Prevotella stercoripullorum]|nr:hypothetical protein [Candidatus Prevotella stercoripullorum]
MKKLLSTMFLIVLSCFYAFSAEVTEDFETLGKTFEMNNAGGGTATVANNPSGSGKVLFLQNSDWNTVPEFHFTLPEGKTLGDCTSVSFSIYIPSNNSDYYANCKQRHVYLNGRLVYKDVNDKGEDAYPTLGEKDSWAGQTISISQFDLTEDERQLTKFTIAMGINDQTLHYYMDNVTVRYPFNTAEPVLPTEGAFYTGEYRNLFLEAGYTQAQVDQRLADLWHTYFEGDENNERLYYEVPGDMAYILDTGNDDVRSEGMSYGMMLCVQLDKQEQFNKLWKWAKTKMQHQSGALEGYFAWKLNSNGGIMDEKPASDGEEYFIMALMFASNRWGNGEGMYNYEAEADYIIKNCFNKPMEGHLYSGYTNLFDMTEKQITFQPYAASATFTDPSYHLPAFYELWAMWAKEHNQDFRDFAAKSRKMFPKFAHETTGLMPDYANYDGTPHEDNGHQDFRFDAWRCIMNMAVDFSWFQPEGVNYTALVNRQHNFLASKGGVPNYQNLYTLDGQLINGNTNHSPGLVACNATGALASNQMVAWEFIDDFMATAIPTGKYRYYDGLLYYLNFLHVSGNFKIWKPKTGTGITDVSATPRIRIDGGVIRLGGNAGGRYRIVSLGGGTVVMSGDVPSSATIDIAALPRGIYAISIEGETLKFIK